MTKLFFLIMAKNSFGYFNFQMKTNRSKLV